MADLEKKVINIQNAYFSLLQESYGDLIQIYEKESSSVKEAVNKYLQRYSISVEYESYLANKKNMFRKKVTAFWKTNKDEIAKFIKEKTNVGLLGSIDDTLPFSYLDEVKRNSLFYDVIVLNDPFYELGISFKESREVNVDVFYRNILTLWNIKKYVLLNNETVFTIIFPFSSLFTEEEKMSLLSECYEDSYLWASEMFGVNEKNTPEELVEILKNMSLTGANVILKSNGILQSIAEAMSYSQSVLSEQEKRGIELYCLERWGEFNRDLLEGIMLRRAIPNLVLLNNYIYKYHTRAASELKSLPIIAYNEWAPLQRDAKNHSFQVSTDYMYTCAVHRNDNMSALMDLDYETIISCREKQGCEDYRSFFRRATQDIVNTHENFDEIANEVFARTDELFQKEYRRALEDRRWKKTFSIIGFIKSALGFVPHISLFLSSIDLLQSGEKVFKSLREKPTVIEYIYTRDKNS